jgi:hypothetical protein
LFQRAVNEFAFEAVERVVERFVGRGLDGAVFCRRDST